MSREQPSEVLTQMNGGEFRFYRYIDPETGEVSDLLSVTSIRSLCGEGYQLANWKLANLADAALGTMKRTVVGPRGGVKSVRQVWEYPSTFAARYLASEGQQAKIDELRKDLRAQADEPRNIAARRGSMSHAAIEKDVAWDRIERPWVESAFSDLSARDRAAAKAGVTDEDVSFIRNTDRHYWSMREEVPMVILAREVRIVNLSVGYAGTFDALAWLLGTFEDDGEGGQKFIPLPAEAQARAHSLKPNKVTVNSVNDIGGTLVMLDWKTGENIHTDNVVQAHAYLAAEFAVTDKVDARITALLTKAMYAGLVHLRPNGWKLHLFPYEDEAIRAFLGSVAFARYIAKYPKPEPIFAVTLRGASNETDEEVTDD